MNRIVAALLLWMMIFCQSDLAQAYSSYVNSTTDPGVNCSDCHSDGRQWEAAALTAPTLNVSTSGLVLSMSWTSVSGATGYMLYYAPYPFTGTDAINSVDMGTATDFSATLWEGAAYYVTVTAYNSISESVYSNIGLFIIETAPAPDAPTLSVSTSGVEISLSWSSVPDVTGYTLYYAPYSEEGEAVYESVDMGTTTEFSATLWPGAEYYVAVTSWVGEVESGYSNIELITVLYGFEIDIEIAPNIINLGGNMETFVIHTNISYGSVDPSSVTLNGDDNYIYSWKRDSLGFFDAIILLNDVEDTLVIGKVNSLLLKGETCDSEPFWGINYVLVIDNATIMYSKFWTGY